MEHVTVKGSLPLLKSAHLCLLRDSDLPWTTLYTITIWDGINICKWKSVEWNLLNNNSKWHINVSTFVCFCNLTQRQLVSRLRQFISCTSQFVTTRRMTALFYVMLLSEFQKGDKNRDTMRWVFNILKNLLYLMFN